jgi:cytochrome c5
MSEHPQEDPSHSSFIKTPAQLAAVVVLAFVVPIALISIFASLVTSSHESARSASPEVIAQRLKPVGQVVIAEGSDTPGQRSGKQIVESVCAACHTTGALSAPKIGDAGAWAPRLKEGFEHLTEMAIKGVRQMPPRGGDPSLADVEVARAVAFMANQSGGKFTEPPVQQAAAVRVAAAGAPATDAAAGAAAPAPAGASAAGGDAAKGKTVFDATCNVCHGAGIAGAPKAGDKAAWAPRIKQGVPAMYEAALKGKGAMPPKGGNNALSEADVKAAVDHMVGLVK